MLELKFPKNREKSFSFTLIFDYEKGEVRTVTKDNKSDKN